MKYLAKEYIISMIVLLLFFILFFAFAILLDNPLLGIFSSIVLIVLSAFVFYKMYEWYPKHILKVSKDRYNEYKLKESQSLFEKLYVYAYDDTANEIMKNIIDDKNINHIYNLDFDCSYNKDYITMVFNYRKHSIYYDIYNNKVLYYIDSPRKYDHLECNKEYEKTKKININISSYGSLDLFFQELIPSIIENINEVDKFEENVNLLNINEITLDEINDYKDYSKQMFVFLNVLCIIMLGISVGFTFWFIKDYGDLLKEKTSDAILLSILVVIFDLFVIGSYIYSIAGIVFCKIIENDIKTQVVEEIKAKPNKVKLISASVGNKSTTFRFCSGVKLYFKDNKKIRLIFPHYFNRTTKEQKLKIIKEFLKKELELKYYKKSKIVVNGLESYRKVIRRIMK